MALIDFGDDDHKLPGLYCVALRPSAHNANTVLVEFNRPLSAYEQDFLLEVCKRSAPLMESPDAN